jgi:hypothetical protein
MQLRRWLVASLVCGGAVLGRDAFAQAPGEDGAPPPPPPPPPPPASMQPMPMQPQPPMPGGLVAPAAPTHHGVFVRMLIGPGGFDATSTIGTDKYEVSGSGGGFSLAIGGAVSPSLVVYGELFDDVAVGPTITMNDQTVATSGQDVRAGVVGIGPGFAYYLPSNLYVGATLALSRITFQQGNSEVAHSDNGVGVSVHVGKEWWVSSNWGLGIALQAYGGKIPDQQSGVSWTAAGATLAFSATYN